MTIYCDKCGARHECSACPVCAGFGLSKLQEAAGVGKSFRPTDELRAKFEAWWEENYFYVHEKLASLKEYAWMGWQAAHASRDAEVEALRKDAERYRWLRAATNRDWTVVKDSGKGGVYQYYGQDVDATIDAAMAKESGG